jgi:hypothetical protein
MSFPDPEFNTPGPPVHFGGPDLPERALRDVLKARIEAVPPGGWIRWATYYFRDMDLGAALVAAATRGVDVRIAVEGRPRRRDANHDVLALLRQGMPPRSLCVHEFPAGLLAKAHPHLHAKIYAFSHPRPAVLVGSFNPSGNEPEDPEVIAEIGDQDRGHNVLLELAEPELVRGLCAHVDGLCGPNGTMAARFLPSQNRVLRAAETDVYFFPRLNTGVLDRVLSGEKAQLIRGVISHLKSGQLAGKLESAARAGTRVELLVHDTERRVPQAAIAGLSAEGVSIRRYMHPAKLPLHAKFLILQSPTQSHSFFGSFNFNPRSRYLNHEVLVHSRDAGLFTTLNARFDAIAREVDGFAPQA